MYDQDWFNERYYHKRDDNSFMGGYIDYTPEKIGWMYDRAAKYIKDVFNPVNLYDFGCAKGLMIRSFINLGVDAYGCDWSEYAVKTSYAPDRVAQADMTKPIKDKTKYDMTISFDVLEHIEEQHTDTALKNIIDRTERLSLLYIPLDTNPSEDETHVNLKTREWWEDKIRKHGEIIDSRQYHAGVDWFYIIESMFIVKPYKHGVQR
jgi:hypothetical protein